MTITGIDAVTYGVANLTKATTFFADWGLERRSRGATKAVFATADGSEVVVRPRSAKALPKAIERKSTIRALTWGVTAKRDLTVIERELGNDREVEHDRDGTLWSTDDNGLALGFRVSRRKRLTSKPTGVNAPGAIQRVDQRATYYERAHPLTIGHVVMNVRDRERTKRFYMERLDLRCQMSTKVGGFSCAPAPAPGITIYSFSKPRMAPPSTTWPSVCGTSTNCLPAANS